MYQREHANFYFSEYSLWCTQLIIVMKQLFYIISIGLCWTPVQMCNISEDAAAYLPGDIMIGGLFPIHKGVSNLLEKTENNSFQCNRLVIICFIYTH